MIVNIDQNLCTGCGICGDICPRHILETITQNDEKNVIVAPERSHLCLKCGHCVAVCPNNCIMVDGLKSEEFIPFKESGIHRDQLLSLFSQRRSIRRYKNKPVPRDKIHQIVKAAHMAPTGTASRSTGIIVIDKPQILSAFSEHIYKIYEDLEKNLKNPIARFFIKRQIGIKKYRSLLDFVMPGMHWYIHWYKQGKSNEILRDCPVLMLFHSPIFEPMGSENCLVSAFHAIMMAQLVGVGTCFNDLIPPACNRVPEIRKLLDLPEDREVYSSITMGYSKYQFKQMPQRKLAEFRYVD